MSADENIGTLKTTGLSFLWQIKNFSVSRKNVGDYLSSPIFSTTHSSIVHKWNLRLYPVGNKGKSKDCISVFLKYMGENDVQVKVILSLLDNTFRKVYENSFKRLYERESLPFGFIEYKEQNFITDKKNGVLVNDTINILCEIIYDENLAVPLKNNVGEKEQDDHLPNYCRLKEFDEFGKLWESTASADVIIKVGESEIKVHKLIIVHRSPFFQVMFENEVKDKEQSVIEITDIKYVVMKEVLRFMYVGKVNELERIADDLLVAADKYSIRGLKVLCEQHMFKSLTTANAVRYLKVAVMCNSANLKSEIIKFIIGNQKDIVHTSEFKLLPIEIECQVLRAIVGIDLNE